ncbi:MAG: leucine-rich repeat domain-containing protein [Oscillospiraceae bacterium]|nr:leucine-rich repeat domain-containing protein [Oscillospiraceae bacterium]
MKKYWAGIICVCCMLLLIPAALAGQADNAELLTVIVASGPCGADKPEDLIWTLDKTGTLTFIGSGAVADYTWNTQYEDIATTAPWFAYRKQIKNVVFSQGITRIGAYVFYGWGDYKFSELSSVTIPDSVTSIGFAAFDDTALKRLDIPGSVKELETCSFCYINNLTEVTLAEGLCKIDARAFEGCGQLSSLTIPASVTEIGEDAFKLCPNLILTVSPDSYAWRYALENTLRHKVSGGNTVYIAGGTCGANLIWTLDENGGMTFIGSGAMTDYAHFKDEDTEFWTTTAPWFPYHNQIKSVKIPNGVTRIGSNAFYGSNDHQFPALSAVTLPDSVTSIGAVAFCNCDALTGMDIPLSVKTIEKWAFNHCDKLSALTIPASVTEIGVEAFIDCPNLTLTVYENSYAHRYALLNSVRHEAIPAPFAIRSIAQAGQTIKADIENPSGNSVTLAVVAYAENGQFIRLAIAGTNSSGAVIVPLDTSGAKTVKSVLLDGDTQRPLCEGKSCDIQ